MENGEYSARVPRNSQIHRILDAHDSGHHTFISHLDKQPVGAKKKVFFIYVLIYLLLSAFILWRFFNGSTRYLPMLIPGFETFGLIDRPGRNPSTSMLWTMINIGIDSVVATSLLPAVQFFLVEHVWLRVKYGFRPVEVVFRTPTNWEASNLQKLTSQARENKIIDSISAVANAKWLDSRPGDSTWNHLWRVECRPSAAVYDALAKGNAEFSLDDWQLTVWQKKLNGTWDAWELWKVNRDVGSRRFEHIFSEVKTKLVAMGKEDVFNQLMHILNDSTRQSNTQRQMEINQLFEREGLDIANLWDDARAATENQAELTVPAS